MLKRILMRAGIGFLIGMVIGNLIAILTGNANSGGERFTSLRLIEMAGGSEAVAMISSDRTVVIDTSTAHRTADDWVYGFPEIGGRREKIRTARRIANPGCHASGFIALVAPLTEYGLLDPAAALSGLKASVYLDSVEEASAFLSGGVIPAGSFLVVDREGVSVPDGKIAVDVEMDGDLLSKVALQGEASPSLVSKMESLGVSQDRYKAAVLEQMASGPGCTVILEEAVDAVRAKISGVRIGEIGDRLANARLPQLEGEDMQRWLKDAAAIQAVSITVDAKRGELRVDTVVNNVHRAETRKLTDSEVMALSARGRISKAEMKDIVMQLHPDIFKTYSVGGKSLFVDPLDDYIRGRSPRTSAEVLKEKAALRKAEGEKKGKSAGPRIS